MEHRINEEKIEQAKKAIASGNFTIEQISTILKLPLPVVQELASRKGA